MYKAWGKLCNFLCASQKVRTLPINDLSYSIQKCDWKALLMKRTYIFLDIFNFTTLPEIILYFLLILKQKSILSRSIQAANFIKKTKIADLRLGVASNEPNINLVKFRTFKIWNAARKKFWLQFEIKPSADHLIN